MNYEEFLNSVELCVRRRMGEGVRTCIIPVMKNNSIRLDGLSILQGSNNVSPAIYLNDFYQDFLSGEPLENIVTKVIDQYYQGMKIGKLDTAFFTDPEKVRERVVCRLINYEKNRELLRVIPHRCFLDLAVVYYCLMDHEAIGNAAVLIRDEHLSMWGMDEDTLHESAVRNTRCLLPHEFVSMAEMMNAMMQCDLFEEEKSPEIPLYILSNREKCFGAVWMTDSEVLEEIADQLHGNYYVLPSSVHECMILPMTEGTDEKMLSEMVREINGTQVSPEEVLADTVYEYDRGLKLLRITTEEKEREVEFA